MMSIVLKFRKKLKSIFFWIWKQDGTPAERARGVVVGIFSGCFPFFGLQSMLGICLASMVRGHHLLAAVGTWISNPFTYIPLYLFNYKVGAFLLGKEDNLIDLNQLTQQQMWNQGLLISNRILIGSLIVGIFSGLAMGCISYILFKKFHNRKTCI